MKGKDLISALKRKFDISTDKDLMERLGLTVTKLNNWRNDTTNISPSKIATLIHSTVTKCEKEARLFSIRPIVEYYRLEPADSAQGAKWELFETKGKDSQRHAEVKSHLKKSNGIYIFYDSQCKALYVGKAKGQNLWQEMNNAFNRERATQKLQMVKHPMTGQAFSPSYEKHRQIKSTQLYLHDLAQYVSAYAIEEDLIDNIEAMLVRGFANTVLNARMEKIKLKK